MERSSPVCRVWRSQQSASVSLTSADESGGATYGRCTSSSPQRHRGGCARVIGYLDLSMAVEEQRGEIKQLRSEASVCREELNALRQEWDERWEQLRQDFSTLAREGREDVAGLRECLFEIGTLQPAVLAEKKHRMRRAAASKVVRDAAFAIEDIALSIALFAGLAAVRFSMVVCGSLRSTMDRVWPAVRAACARPAIYVCGGRADGGRILDSVERFNPLSNGAGTWDVLPRMLERRVGASAGFCAGRLYVCGGWSNDGQAVSSVERFDPEQSGWEMLAPMFSAREATSAGVIGGKLYVCGGFNSDRLPLTYAERYDPAVNEWEPLPPMLGRRGGAAAVALGARFFVCGGRDRDGPLLSAEYFDSPSCLWVEMAPMSSTRVAAVAAAVKKKLYVCGGWSNSWEAQNSTEIFNSEDGTWTSGPCLLTARSGAAIASVAGQIYVFGGHDGSEHLSTVEFFDSAQGVWTLLCTSLPERRLFVTAAAAFS